jgi:signal transduction histidine kinase
MSLYQKMLGFAALIVVFAAMVVVFAVIERTAMQERNDAYQLQIFLLKANEHKAMLLFNRSTHHAERVEQSLRAFRELLHRYRLEESGKRLTEHSMQYSAAFQQMVAKLVERGVNENAGAEGKLRASIHAIEQIVTASQAKELESLMLSARRSEKDFLLRGDSVYIEKVRRAVAALREQAATTALSDQQRQHIQYLAQEYWKNFERTAALLQEIHAADRVLKHHSESMIPILDAMVAEKSRHAEATEQQMMLLLAISCVLSMIVALVIARRLSLPIIQLRNAATDMAVSFHATEVHVHTRDEVAELAGAFNTMLQNIRERTLQLQTANHELHEANTHIQRQNRILSEQASDIELYNTELQEKNERLHELNTEKNEFLGIVAHDLKNPLSGITMLAKVLHEQSGHLSSKEIQDIVGDIQQSSTRMFELITNLLDVNALDQGAVQLRTEMVDMDEITWSLVEYYTPRAMAKGITLQYVYCNDECCGYADASATRQVLDNLISNAIKYSPRGKKVTVRLASREQAWMRLEVQDEGQGLSDEDKQRLFGKFARLSARPTAGEHSTGLGLSIVKTMVERMKGRVWCESEYGHGATFIVELPACCP